MLLTGTFDKPLAYDSTVYADQHYRFHEALRRSDAVIAIGYGFRDKAINSRLVGWLHSASGRRLIVITVVEEARAEAAGTVAAERWAREFPSEQADAASLRLERMRGGRLTRALPDFKGSAVASQVCKWLRDDAAWLNTVLEREQQNRDELDIREDAVWESTPEGDEALNREKKRIIAGLAPRHTREAGSE